jgi:hypothetical protein
MDEKYRNKNNDEYKFDIVAGKDGKEHFSPMKKESGALGTDQWKPAERTDISMGQPSVGRVEANTDPKKQP